MLRKKKTTSKATQPVQESKSLLESLTEQLNSIPPTITETRRIGTGFGVRTRTVEVPNPEYVALQNQIAALQTVPPEPTPKTPEPAQKTPDPSFVGPVAPDNLPTSITPLSLSGIQGLLPTKTEAPAEPAVEQPKIAVAPKLTQKTVTPQKAEPEAPVKVVDPIRETTRPAEEFAPPTLASLSSQTESPSVSDFVGPPGPANVPTDTAPLTLSGIEGLLQPKPETPPVNLDELKKALAGVGDLSGGVSFTPDIKTDVPLDVGTVESDKYIEDTSRFSRDKLDPTGQKIYDQLKQQRESMEKAIGAEKASELYTSIGDLTPEETLAMMASELRDTGITDIYKVKQQDGIVQAPIQYGEIESAGEGAAREGYYYRDPRTNQIKEVDPSQVKDFQAAIPGRYTDGGEGGGEYTPGVAASGYVEVPVKQYVNTETGELLKQDISRSEYQTSDNILGDSSVAKRTYTGTGVQFTPDGVPIYFSTGFKQPSSWVRFRDQVRAIAPLAVAFIPGIGQAFTAAASSILGAGASQAAVTALSKGLASAVAGTIATGDLEKGILSGLTSGALGYGLGALQGLADVAYIPEVSASQLEAIGTGPLNYGVAAMEPSVAAEALTSLASDPNIAEEVSNILSDAPKGALAKLPEVFSDPNLAVATNPAQIGEIYPDLAEVIETGGPTNVSVGDQDTFDITDVEPPVKPATSLNEILNKSTLEDLGISTGPALEGGLAAGDEVLLDSDGSLISSDGLSADGPLTTNANEILDTSSLSTPGIESDLLGSDESLLGTSLDDSTNLSDVSLSNGTSISTGTESLTGGDFDPASALETQLGSDTGTGLIVQNLDTNLTNQGFESLTGFEDDLYGTSNAKILEDILGEGTEVDSEIFGDNNGASSSVSSDDAVFDDLTKSTEVGTETFGDGKSIDDELFGAGTGSDSEVFGDAFESNTQVSDGSTSVSNVSEGTQLSDESNVLQSEADISSQNTTSSLFGDDVDLDLFGEGTGSEVDTPPVGSDSGLSTDENIFTKSSELDRDLLGDDLLLGGDELLGDDALGLFNDDLDNLSIGNEILQGNQSDLPDGSDNVFESEPDGPDGGFEVKKFNDFDGLDLDNLDLDDFEGGTSVSNGTGASSESTGSLSEGNDLFGNDSDLLDDLLGSDSNLLEDDLLGLNDNLGISGGISSESGLYGDTEGGTGVSTTGSTDGGAGDGNLDGFGDDDGAGTWKVDWDGEGTGEDFDGVFGDGLSGGSGGVSSGTSSAGSETGTSGEQAGGQSSVGGSLGNDDDLSYLNTTASQDAAAAGSDTGNLTGNVMTSDQVAAALAQGSGDPYIASEIAGVDPSAWDVPDLTDMQEFFKSPAGKLAYNQFTSLLLNKLKNDASLASAANLLGKSGIAGLGAGSNGIAGLGASSPSVQFGYIPDFDITKAFSPTLYALRQRGQ